MAQPGVVTIYKGRPDGRWAAKDVGLLGLPARQHTPEVAPAINDRLWITLPPFRERLRNNVGMRYMVAMARSRRPYDGVKFVGDPLPEFRETLFGWGIAPGGSCPDPEYRPRGTALCRQLPPPVTDAPDPSRNLFPAGPRAPLGRPGVPHPYVAGRGPVPAVGLCRPWACARPAATLLAQLAQQSPRTGGQGFSSHSGPDGGLPAVGGTPRILCEAARYGCPSTPSPNLTHACCLPGDVERLWKHWHPEHANSRTPYHGAARRLCIVHSQRPGTLAGTVLWAVDLLVAGYVQLSCAECAARFGQTDALRWLMYSGAALLPNPKGENLLWFAARCEDLGKQRAVLQMLLTT
eukprot:gene10756-1955_t